MEKQRKKFNWRLAVAGFGVLAIFTSPLFAWVDTVQAAGETFTWTPGGGSLTNQYPGSAVTITGSDILPGSVSLRQNVGGSTNYIGEATVNGCTFDISVNVGNLPPANGQTGTFAAENPSGNCAGINVSSISRTPSITVTADLPEGVTCDAPLTYDGNACSTPANPDGTCSVEGTTLRPGSRDPANGNNGICERAPTDPNAPAQGAEADNCPIEEGQEFRWAMCPLFDIMGGFTNTLDYFIHQYLSTGNDIYSAQEQNFKNAWETFRNIGIALVVIAGLVMLISEALSIPIVDAYTVRKVLPRLFVAIVGIAISWEFCKLLIEFFDYFGQAVGSAIYSSFTVPNGPQGESAGLQIWGTIISALLAGGLATGAAILLTGAGVISLIGTLLLALLSLAALLIIRQAIIIACVIIAPLAIAAFILPNTSKLAQTWWSTFINLLLLYPIVAGITALSKVLGKITMNINGV